MSQEPSPFFVMPGSALIDLREELELIEDERAKETLARYGYRAGVGLIKSLGVDVPSLDQLREVLPQLWSETGLGRMRIQDIAEERLTVALEESIEARNGRRCDFTRGYLAGIVSTLMKRRYEALETECISDGKERCVHQLLPAAEPQEGTPKAEGARKNDLEPGYSYLLESEDANAGFDVFVDYVSHGTKGLWISREYPEKVKKRFDIGGLPHIWLSYERDIAYAREPTNIPLIYAEIKGFLDDSAGGIVLLSGLEYMMSQNTFLKVLKFLQLLNENVAVKEALLLIPLSPQALSSREVKMLERELRVYQPR